MKNINILLYLYTIVFTLLIVHEIDSAYWKEWEMFNLPGGIQLFNFIHIVLIPPLLLGYGEIIKGTRKGIVFSILTGFLGLFAFVIHSIFFTIGYNQFDNPTSISILFLLLMASVILLVKVYKTQKELHLKGELYVTYKII
jgi:hypothetical protein